MKSWLFELYIYTSFFSCTCTEFCIFPCLVCLTLTHFGCFTLRDYWFCSVLTLITTFNLTTIYFSLLASCWLGFLYSWSTFFLLCAFELDGVCWRRTPDAYYLEVARSLGLSSSSSFTLFFLLIFCFVTGASKCCGKCVCVCVFFSRQSFEEWPECFFYDLRKACFLAHWICV